MRSMNGGKIQEHDAALTEDADPQLAGLKRHVSVIERGGLLVIDDDKAQGREGRE